MDRAGGGVKKKKIRGVVRGLFVSVSVYMASAAPLNQVERSRGLLCKLQPWLKSSALKYWMINQREGVQYLGIRKTCLFPTFAKFYPFLNVFEKSTNTFFSPFILHRRSAVFSPGYVFYSTNICNTKNTASFLRKRIQIPFYDVYRKISRANRVGQWHWRDTCRSHVWGIPQCRISFQAISILVILPPVSPTVSNCWSFVPFSSSSSSSPRKNEEIIRVGFLFFSYFYTLYFS